MKRALAVIFAVWSFATSAQVQLTDFDRGPSGTSSNPRFFAAFGGEVYFLAQTTSRGAEVWKSDGTEEGTTLLKDINAAGSSDFKAAVELNGNLYFMADDGIYGYQLWATDGSKAGTLRVTDHLKTAHDQVVRHGDRLYILESGTDGHLWKSDGTKEGTSLVKGHIPGPTSSLTSAIDLVFFAENSADGILLWRSDGTQAGTFVISGPHQAHFSGSSYLTQLVEYNGAMYFVARGAYPDGSINIMKTDGTVAGTEVVASVDNATGYHTFSDVIVHAGKMYFAFHDFWHGDFFIVESQGDAASTVLIYSYTSESATAYFSPSALLGTDGHLLFSSGYQGETWLIKLNLTTYQTVNIKKLAGPQNAGFFFPDLDVNAFEVAAPDKIFVRSNRSMSYADLWITDGTADGTYMLSTIAYFYPNMTLLNGQLYFSGTADSDFELWKSDGTEIGTVQVRDINTEALAVTFGFEHRVVNENAIFSVDTPETGNEIIVSDGTPEATDVIDLRPGLQHALPHDLTPFNGKVYFAAYAPEGGFAIYSSDGTASGTNRVAGFAGASSYSPQLESDGINRLFILGAKQDGTTSLYALTGSSDDVAEVTNFGTYGMNAPYFAGEPAMVGQTLFMVISGNNQSAVWKSDGTASGTVKVADIPFSGDLQGAGDQLFFSAYDPIDGYELFRSDGTAEGTGIVRDLNGPIQSRPGNLFAFGDKLLFTATEEDKGTELWITDGTAPNTDLLKDILPGPLRGMTNLPSFVQFGNIVLFAANDGTHGAELWKTDGTTEGTVMLKDIHVGSESSVPGQFVAGADGVYFAATTNEHGRELWFTDGTNAGTALVLDLCPGAEYSNPCYLSITDGGRLYFVAANGTSGYQLWRYDTPVTSVADRHENNPKIYPNPSPGIYHIETGEFAEGRLAIYDTLGNCVSLTEKIEPSFDVNITGLTSGLYVMKFTKGRKVKILKVVRL